jgi:hypothetical protein
MTWPNSDRSSCRAAAAEIGYVEGSVRTLMARLVLLGVSSGASSRDLTLLRFRLWRYLPPVKGS